VYNNQQNQYIPQNQNYSRAPKQFNQNKNKDLSDWGESKHPKDLNKFKIKNEVISENVPLPVSNSVSGSVLNTSMPVFNPNSFKKTMVAPVVAEKSELKQSAPVFIPSAPKP
jgi:hypothetical protein